MSIVSSSGRCFQATGPQRRAHSTRSCLARLQLLCHASKQQQKIPSSLYRSTRRDVLAVGVGMLGLIASAQEAKADIGKDLARAFLRPELGTQEAVVVLMDARSTLKQIQVIAATPSDSDLRFRSRASWPGFAKRLREAGPAAPIVAGLITGSNDKEATLSEMYGGKAESASKPAITDAVYIGLGKVLTISGRTIKDEAQASPELAREAEKAIDDLLNQLPPEIVQQAQDFRIKRAAAAGQRS